ncbi:MAG: hypothetical protein KME59_17055 [Trichormus sp. ATA11-4-KO1]|nr:hypothetical protein [Trichormus sp. ATA11-4-KO1]
MRQLARLPRHLQAWLWWLILCSGVATLFFLSHPFGLAVSICQMGNIIFGGWLALRFGLVKLLGLAHLIWWTPIPFLFVFYYQSLDSSLLMAWAWEVTGTVLISLVLDARDFFQWCRGERAPMVDID